MNRRIIVFSALILVAAALIAVCLIRLFPVPTTTEVERVFSGDEAAFIETAGLFDLWNWAKDTPYVRTGGYLPLLEITAVWRILQDVGKGEEVWGKGIDMDAVMAMVGNESAVGIYPDGGSTHFLFVSRVEPNFLLMERLFIFAREGKDVTVTKYRGVRVKDAGTGDGRRLRYALDGDFLILSDDRDIFFSALDRSLDKAGGGGLASLPSFRRLAREREEGTLVSGFVLTEGIMKVPAVGEALSGPVRMIVPGSFRFSLARRGDIVTLVVRGDSGWRIFPRSLSKRKKEAFPEISGTLMSLSLGDLPGLSREEIAALLASERSVITQAPSLFPEGFHAYLAPDRARRRPPAFVVVGERSASFEAVLEATIEKERLSSTVESAGGIDLVTYKKDGVSFFSLAETDGAVVISDDPASVADAVSKTLETKRRFCYSERETGLRLVMRPGAISEEMEMFPDSLTGMLGGLSSGDTERLFLGLSPVGEVDIGLSVTGGASELMVDMRMEDRVP